MVYYCTLTAGPSVGGAISLGTDARVGALGVQTLTAPTNARDGQAFVDICRTHKNICTYESALYRIGFIGRIYKIYSEICCLCLTNALLGSSGQLVWCLGTRSRSSSTPVLTLSRGHGLDFNLIHVLDDCGGNWSIQRNP